MLRFCARLCRFTLHMHKQNQKRSLSKGLTTIILRTLSKRNVKGAKINEKSSSQATTKQVHEYTAQRSFPNIERPLIKKNSKTMKLLQPIDSPRLSYYQIYSSSINFCAEASLNLRNASSVSFATSPCR